MLEHKHILNNTQCLAKGFNLFFKLLLIFIYFFKHSVRLLSQSSICFIRISVDRECKAYLEEEGKLCRIFSFFCRNKNMKSVENMYSAPAYLINMTTVKSSPRRSAGFTGLWVGHYKALHCISAYVLRLIIQLDEWLYDLPSRKTKKTIIKTIHFNQMNWLHLQPPKTGVIVGIFTFVWTIFVPVGSMKAPISNYFEVLLNMITVYHLYSPSSLSTQLPGPY